MDPLTAALVMGVGALVVGAYKTWGSKKVKGLAKKLLDDPKTKEDESLAVGKQIDGFAQDVLKLAVKAAIEEGLKEARKNPKLDQVTHTAEILVGKYQGGMSLEDAKKLVSEALKK
jgi:hypothetical protein